ncbi:exo-alpha-sialidase [Algoriphagus lutimaris]|uniref:sialidase family protein n=1 Tax=Algoriphagus lutimaris TaxID=613197 RepID=UPI00196B3B21|nr:sialidase family protein [Algoriphagus lutimaris]MBN3519237.1 exo-alpha-sialidase [Algoriphagus lutimaris]
MNWNHNKLTLPFLLFSLLTFCKSPIDEPIITLAEEGDQPSMSKDLDGNLGITYGNGKDIYFAFSTDEGSTFSTDKVGTLENMFLGMSCGPRLAMGTDYYSIVAPTKKGDLVAFRKNKGNDTWEGPFQVNDIRGSAGESLADITADTQGNLFATWIDTRSVMPEMDHGNTEENHAEMDHSKGKTELEATKNNTIPKELSKEEIMAELGEMPEGGESIRQYPGEDGKMYWVVLDKDGKAIKAKDMDSYRAFRAKNSKRKAPEGKIYIAKSTDGGKSWSKSQLVYSSPDGSVCECCMPTIQTDKDDHLYIMFRNNLNGSRDLHLAISKDNGNSFGSPIKLGQDTWKLNGCPMDGGGFRVTNQDNIATVWQRDGQIFFAQPEEKEIKIGNGRSPSIDEGTKGDYITWSEGENIMFLGPNSSNGEVLAKGAYSKTISTDQGDAMLIVWTEEGKIKMKKVS